MKKVICWFILGAAGVAFAQPSVPPKMPFHFVNYWWDCELKNEDFKSFSMQIKIEGDISDADFIYIAPISGKVNETQFYGGLQTNTGGWKTKVAQKRTWVGRGGIFSRWAEDGITPLGVEFADGELGTLFESATYEGSFVSVRRKAGWGNGNFRYEIKKLSQQKAPQKFAWYGAYLIDEQKQSSVEIGRLKFVGDHFQLQSFASFIESYGVNKNRIPNMKISLKSPVINDRPCSNTSVYVVYPHNDYEPYTRYAETYLDEDWVVSLISEKKIEGPKKDVRLYVRKNLK
jgi:hypothetical protein